MKSPLYGKLKKYVEENVYPFHMPGHKMGNGLEENNVFAMDITEINDFDNLFKPEGIIKEAQQLMAKTFGAEESFFLVNGSSSGIIAAITSVCSDGDTILLARNCHKSVFNGLVVSGARPVYIMPTELEEIPVFGAINPKDVEFALEKNPQTKAVVITSPTYEGIVSDIEKISEIAHNYKIPLIVDEAHGAHFNFNHFFPKSAIKCGADMVIQSLHKTLPAPTQTAVLHIRKGLVNEVRLKKTLELVQTSSPSYIFMGMIDKLRDFLDTDGERAFEVYVESLKDLRKYISGLHNIKLLDSDIIGNNSIFNLDL
ncbi:MAG: aminotransferase class I/II-fold pyridoxal phosphate-dependent enzyme, partial [Anaerotignaceae bacterium]